MLLWYNPLLRYTTTRGHFHSGETRFWDWTKSLTARQWDIQIQKIMHRQIPLVLIRSTTILTVKFQLWLDSFLLLHQSNSSLADANQFKATKTEDHIHIRWYPDATSPAQVLFFFLFFPSQLTPCHNGGSGSFCVVCVFLSSSSDGVNVGALLHASPCLNYGDPPINSLGMTSGWEGLPNNQIPYSNKLLKHQYTTWRL